MKKVTKAVIPAAGYGSRFLPATKAMPREMLPILNKPTIQYVVEEAVASGIDDILIITGRGKRSIEDHFDHNFALDQTLRERGKGEVADSLVEISEMATFHYVRQPRPIGLGDAILRARKHLDDQPFACLLGDDILRADPPCTKQLIDSFASHGESVLAIEKMPDQHLHRYGVFDVDTTPEERLYRVKGAVEKPATRAEAPSNFVANGRYILGPDIFDHLEQLDPNHRGVIQLTDGLDSLSREGRLMALEYRGERWYDTGNVLDFVIANLEAVLENDGMRAGAMEYLRSLKDRGLGI